MKILSINAERRAEARELIEADPASPSGLRWKVSRGNARAGSPAGFPLAGGYWKVEVNRKRYHAHRLVWALTHDEDPGDRGIDHIDGNRGNNDPANLQPTRETPLSRPGFRDGRCVRQEQGAVW